MSSALPASLPQELAASATEVCGRIAAERVREGLCGGNRQEKRQIYLLNLSQHGYRIVLYNTVSFRSGLASVHCPASPWVLISRSGGLTRQRGARNGCRKSQSNVYQITQFIFRLDFFARPSRHNGPETAY